jgi:hypothetical protein
MNSASSANGIHATPVVGFEAWPATINCFPVLSSPTLDARLMDDLSYRLLRRSLTGDETVHAATAPNVGAYTGRPPELTAQMRLIRKSASEGDFTK